MATAGSSLMATANVQERREASHNWSLVTTHLRHMRGNLMMMMGNMAVQITNKTTNHGDIKSGAVMINVTKYLFQK